MSEPQKPKSKSGSSKKNENVHIGHRERMRKRFLETNLEGFSDHQIVEFLLFYAIPRMDTNVIAHKLIDRFGSIDKLIDASPEELRLAGLSENAVVLFKLIPQIANVYYLAQRMEKESYSSTADLQMLFAPLFVGLDHEELKMACFDNDLSLMGIVNISQGNRNSTALDIRKIIEEAAAHKCAYVAISHNHPHVNLLASPEDERLTEKIRELLSEIGIELIDHIIVNSRGAYSMKSKTIMFHEHIERKLNNKRKTQKNNFP